jgi:hypothetical protein
MNAADISVILLEDQKEWEALSAVLDARLKGVVHGIGSTSWNARDVYAHVARWLEYSNSNLENALTGKPLSNIQESQFDEINGRWQQEDSKLSLVEAQIIAYQEFQRRAKIIKSIPLEKWNEEMVKIVYSDGASHYRLHRSYITD